MDFLINYRTIIATTTTKKQDFEDVSFDMRPHQNGQF